MGFTESPCLLLRRIERIGAYRHLEGTTRFFREARLEGIGPK